MTAKSGEFLGDREKIARRMEEWQWDLRPSGAMQVWVAGQVVGASVRLDRCTEQEDAWRRRESLRAGESWEVDRQAEAARLAEGLARRPEAVALELRRTPHGCDWLVGRFRMLAALVRGTDGDGPQRPLDEEDRRLACDVLGLAPELRRGRTPLDP